MRNRFGRLRSCSSSAGGRNTCREVSFRRSAIGRTQLSVRKTMRFVPSVIGVLGIMCAGVARSQDAGRASESTGKINLVVATLGGKQVWADELVFWGWRIQRNSLTDHCRLLDEHDERRD